MVDSGQKTGGVVFFCSAVFFGVVFFWEFFLIFDFLPVFIRE